MTPPVRFVACCTALLVIGGCAKEPLEFTEVKRIDEKVTDKEFRTFVRIVDRLPDQKLPRMPEVFAPLPSWSGARTLPINELLSEEETLLNERWSVEWLARHLQRSRALRRALAAEQISLEQFLGLKLAIGAAMSRSRIDDPDRLSQLIARGETAVVNLEQDTRPFQSLSPEAQHFVLRQAAWLNRVDRATRLSQVPPENVALVIEHWDYLTNAFPQSFQIDPLAAVADRLEEQGVPFEEMPASGFDDQLQWSGGEAIVGRDALPADRGGEVE